MGARRKYDIYDHGVMIASGVTHSVVYETTGLLPGVQIASQFGKLIYNRYEVTLEGVKPTGKPDALDPKTYSESETRSRFGTRLYEEWMQLHLRYGKGAGHECG